MRGRLRSTFDVVPDVPVSKFVLIVNGGKDGLLVNSRNLCVKQKKRSKAQRRKLRRSMRAIVKFKAQNGKKANRKQRVRPPCGKKRGGKAKQGR